MTFSTVKHCRGCGTLIRTSQATPNCWRCARHKAKPQRRCACGEVVRKSGETECVDCRKITRTKASGRPHVPTSVYVQHDPIAKRAFWAAAVQR